MTLEHRPQLRFLTTEQKEPERAEKMEIEGGEGTSVGRRNVVDLDRDCREAKKPELAN